MQSSICYQVVLLDAITRLKINLFLSRLDCGAEDLVTSLVTGADNPGQLTLPMLRYLNTILPSHDEVPTLIPRLIHVYYLLF